MTTRINNKVFHQNKKKVIFWKKKAEQLKKIKIINTNLTVVLIWSWRLKGTKLVQWNLQFNKNYEKWSKIEQILILLVTVFVLLFVVVNQSIICFFKLIWGTTWVAWIQTLNIALAYYSSISAFIFENEPKIIPSLLIL